MTAQIPAERDNLGRLLVDRDLRVPSVAGVFATGDAAKAACDDIGNYALMSCQHATRMGAFAGNNAAADSWESPTKPYHQKAYVTCLDLGEAGAHLHTRLGPEGRDGRRRRRRRPSRRSTPSGSIRREPERAAALASADPEHVTKCSCLARNRAAPTVRGPARHPYQPEPTMMKHEIVRASAFAMPLTSPAFPPGPYRFINREYFIIQYRTDPEALRTDRAGTTRNHRTGGEL